VHYPNIIVLMAASDALSGPNTMSPADFDLLHDKLYQKLDLKLDDKFDRLNEDLMKAIKDSLSPRDGGVFEMSFVQLFPFESITLQKSNTEITFPSLWSIGLQDACLESLTLGMIRLDGCDLYSWMRCNHAVRVKRDNTWKISCQHSCSYLFSVDVCVRATFPQKVIQRHRSFPGCSQFGDFCVVLGCVASMELRSMDSYPQDRPRLNRTSKQASKLRSLV
jgi:hypothetical protein